MMASSSGLRSRLDKDSRGLRSVRLEVDGWVQGEKDETQWMTVRSRSRVVAM